MQSSAASAHSPAEILAGAQAELELRRRARLAVVPEFRGAGLVAQGITNHEWILAGPAETGKTFAALWRLDTLCRQTPGAVASLVRKVQADMAGTVLLTWQRIIAMRGGVKVYGGERPEMYRYEGGARVYVGGLDHPEKVLSGERDWIYVNQAEEVSEEDWETITTRCTGRGAQTKTPMLFGDCNPGPPDHWILKRAAAGHLQLLTSFHKDNPSLWDGQEWTEQGVKTMGTLETTTGIRRSRYLLGEWKGAEGAFFTCFDPDAHPVPAAGLALTPAMPKWIGLDWGYAHKCVAVWFAQLDTKRVGSYRELVVRGKSPEEVAVLMAELSEGERIEEVYFSPEQFAKRSDEQTVAIRLGRVLEEKGLPLPTPAVTARAQGARLCFDTLQDRTWLISRACPSLIACLPKLVTDPDNSEDVLKVDGDDEYDAARYGLMSRRGEITRSRPERITEAVEAKKIPVEDLTARHLAYLKAEHDTRREGPVHFGHRRRR